MCNINAAVILGCTGARAQGQPSSHDLLVVGPGVLGSLVGKLWLESHPGATVIGQTNTTTSHDQCARMDKASAYIGAHTLGSMLSAHGIGNLQSTNICCHTTAAISDGTMCGLVQMCCERSDCIVHSCPATCTIGRLITSQSISASGTTI